MVAQQVLVLFDKVRVLMGQRKEIAIIKWLQSFVMVAQQVLVLFDKVRVLMGQRKEIAIIKWLQSFVFIVFLFIALVTPIFLPIIGAKAERI